MSTLDVTGLKSKVALTPTKFYDKDDKEIGTLCRAWVNFASNGVARASFNVSGIVNNSTGNYTITLTNALPDANYVVAGIGGATNRSISVTASECTASTLKCYCRDLLNALQNDDVYIAIFR